MKAKWLGMMAAVAATLPVSPERFVDAELARLFRTRKPEKYPGQRRAYLIGANCPEGERMRAARDPN